MLVRCHNLQVIFGVEYVNLIYKAEFRVMTIYRAKAETSFLESPLPPSGTPKHDARAGSFVVAPTPK
jgi:hypothetical protein